MRKEVSLELDGDALALCASIRAFILASGAPARGMSVRVTASGPSDAERDASDALYSDVSGFDLEADGGLIVHLPDGATLRLPPAAWNKLKISLRPAS
ncbi:hypothetical protein [Halodurantibacterium flavum]|uniref:Uncharacterized protein n=1 Tax=Halodurantibacterium flavum TaxID=1382802 RepID=A0ABW4S8K0_9RHOB